MKQISALAIVLSLVFVTPALAGDKPPFLGTGGYISMATDTIVAVDFHMPFADDLDLFGFVPEIVAQYGFGPAAIGINLGLAVAVPDEGDTEMFVGNVGLFGKGGFCIPGAFHLCVGGQLEVSLAPFEAKNIGDIAAIAVGQVAHFRANRFGSESLVVSPAVAADLKLSIFWAQAHLGADVYYPYGCDGPGCDTETFITFGVAGGVQIFSVLAVGAGFRVYDLLTEDNTDAQGVMDIIVKLTLGPVEPSLVLAFPLDDDTNDIFPAAMSLGVAGRF